MIFTNDSEDDRKSYDTRSLEVYPKIDNIALSGYSQALNTNQINLSTFLILVLNQIMEMANR